MKVPSKKRSAPRPAPYKHDEGKTRSAPRPAPYKHDEGNNQKQRNTQEIMQEIKDHKKKVLLLDTEFFDSAIAALTQMAKIAPPGTNMEDLAKNIHIVEGNPETYKNMMANNIFGFTIHPGDVCDVSIVLADETDPFQVIYLDLMGNSRSAAIAYQVLKNLVHRITEGTAVAVTLAARGSLPCIKVVETLTRQFGSLKTVAPLRHTQVYGYCRSGNSQTMVFLKYLSSFDEQTLMVRPNKVTCKGTFRYQFGKGKFLLSNDVDPEAQKTEDKFDRVSIYGYGDKYFVWYPTGTVTPSENGVVGTLVEYCPQQHRVRRVA